MLLEVECVSSSPLVYICLYLLILDMLCCIGILYLLYWNPLSVVLESSICCIGILYLLCYCLRACRFIDHLEVMFGGGDHPSWDRDGRYMPSNIQVSQAVSPQSWDICTYASFILCVCVCTVTM